MKPLPGDVAPDFTASVIGIDDSEVSTVTLSKLLGKKVVLVFYPKDDTPGCTTQACELRDDWSALKDRALIYGVSVDDAQMHRKFIEKYRLPYPLISDSDQQIVKAYGVWVEKSMYGKTYFGTERSTFIIGADGHVDQVLEKVAAKEHLALLTAALG
jgi:thioredoxin-dependent peroxiredoxin